MSFPLFVNAQHLFVFNDKTTKVVKIVKDAGPVYYYYEWSDTLMLSKAVFKDDLKKVLKIDPTEIDSVIKMIKNQIIEDSIYIVHERSKDIRFSLIPSIATSFRSDQFNYTISGSCVLVYKIINMLGVSMGYERLNKGQSYILLNSAQLRVFYNRYLTKDPLAGKRYYCGGEFIYGKTISGRYNNAWTSDNVSEEIVMTADYLDSSLGIKLLFGVTLKDKFLIDIGFMDKNLGITYPNDTRRYLVTELRLGYRL